MTYKGYRIEPLGTFSLVRIMAMGSGPIPSSLGGEYTSRTMAVQAIDRSLQSLLTRKRSKTNDKKEGTSSR